MIAFTMGEKHPKLCLSWAVMLTKAQVRHFFLSVLSCIELLETINAKKKNLANRRVEFAFNRKIFLYLYFNTLYSTEQ